MLAAKCDVLLLQEVDTHIDLNKVSLIPGFTAYQCLEADDHRTAIYVRDSFAKGFVLKHFSIVDGFIHGVRFTPTEEQKDAAGSSPLFASTFAVINVYIQAGSSQTKVAKRMSQLESLRSHRVAEETDYIICHGG
jgi:hypothetical protein